MPIPDFAVKTFQHGTITRIEKESLPRGAASDSLNWLTKGDHIELRRGYAVLGNDNAGAGGITGLRVGRRFDGTQVAFRTYGRKVEYYKSSTELWTEVDTANVLPAGADGEDVAIDPYFNIAGSFVYFSSPNSSIYKIHTANPGNIVDQLSTSHRGKIRIKQNRMFLWDRKDTSGGKDQTGLYGSYIDKDELSDYTAVTAESVGTGNGVVKTFAATLAFKAAGAKRTCMYVSVTDGVETFRDDRNGALVGSLAGTGTVNYATGAISVTFNTAPANLAAITSDYYWEDATSQGIADFSKATPRVAGQGFVFRQDEAGLMMNLGSINDVEFCLHLLKTYKLTLSQTDTNATNLIYRQKVGIPYFLAMTETGDGIVYVDTYDTADPYVRLLTIEEGSDTNVTPVSLSDFLDLSDYRFDKAVVLEWGEYVAVSCRHKDSTNNSTMFVRHKLWKSWDRLDYAVSRLDVLDGALTGGSSISNNVFTLFSGLTDEEAEVVNYWISGKSNLDAEGVKVANRFVIGGLIGTGQKLKISISLDEGPFVEIGGSDSGGVHTYAIEGTGSYVDVGRKTTVGSWTIGSKEIGGGGSFPDDIVAYPYRKEFRINTDRFEFVRVRFEATGVGYVSVSEYQFKDVRYKGRRVPVQYLAS